MRCTYILGLLVTFFHIFISVKTANILTLVEVLQSDEHIWHDALLKGLIDRGHTITIVSGGSISITKSPQITQIHLDQITTTLRDKHSTKIFTNSWLSSFEQILNWYDRQMKICKSILSSDGLQEIIDLIKESTKERPYDLILFDATNGPSCLLALAQLMDDVVPIVAISASIITPDLLSVANGAQLQPATVPHFVTDHSENMNFFERLHNTVIYAIGHFYREFVVRSVQEALLAKSELFQNAQINSGLKNVIDRVKVVLVNSHPAIDYAYMLPQNVIEVGGLQFDNVNRALSVEMQTFIDNSNEGVFIITLGHTKCAIELTDKIITSVMNAVDKYPDYGFLWGVEKSLLSTVSDRKNLFVGKWSKRCNILAQRKVKALITTGTHMEIQQTVYHGVPIIGINKIDQHAKDLGFGISVDIDSNPETLTQAIKAIISERTFTNKAKQQQLIFRNRPQHPLDVALWWIEHVLAHPIESGYLFSQVADKTSFLVFHSLDIIAVFVFILVLFSINCFLVINRLRESFRTKNQHENVIKSLSSKRKIKKIESSNKKSQ